MHQCITCRKEKWPWRTCPDVPHWFNPIVIYYCPHQVSWIITNLYMLLDGQWPPEGKDTGYYDTGGRKVRRAGAYFEVPIAVASDVMLRLDQCGKDGTLTRQILAEGWDIDKLAEIQGKPSYMLQAKVHRVINYCSGKRARLITFTEYNWRRNLSASYKKGI